MIPKSVKRFSDKITPKAKGYDPLERGLSERVNSIGAGVEGGRTRRSS